MYSSYLIKLDEELRREIRDFSKFGNKTPRRIQRIKNYLILVNICGEVKE